MKIFFNNSRFYKNPTISELIEMIIKYKINVKLYKYRDALFCFRDITNFLDVDNFDFSKLEINNLNDSNNINKRRSEMYNKNNFM